MGLMSTVDIAASALEAERLRMTLVANNLANAETTRDSSGVIRPYRRRMALFRQGNPALTGSEQFGVQLAEVAESRAAFRRVFDPDHPDAVTIEDLRANPELTPDDVGFVIYPNVQVPTEMVDMVEASRVYQANVQVVAVSRSMARSLLELLA